MRRLTVLGVWERPPSREQRMIVRDPVAAPTTFVSRSKALETVKVF